MPVTPSPTYTPATTTGSTASPDRSPSPTPKPVLAPTAKESRKRSFFDTDLKLKLMRICVLHQGEYARRRKRQFWRDISRVFEAETGVPIRKPGQTVENLIRERREQLRYRSGAAEADTELKQALDAFMERFDEVEMEVRGLAKKEDITEIKAMRHQMMFGRKRSDDDDSEGAELHSPESVPHQKRSRISRSDVLATAINSSTGALVEAISNGMQLLTGALKPCQEEATIGIARETELDIQLRAIDKKVSDLAKQFLQVSNRFTSVNEKLDRLFNKL
ncbi:hypothetical protein V1523DRAFT_425086 [Lipomyces doorenjongii]